MSEERCIADGCRKTAESGRKHCHGHRKRESRHKSLSTPLREWGAEADAYLEAKALEFADAADDDRSQRLARKRLRYAAMRYARSAARPKVPRGPDTAH